MEHAVTIRNEVNLKKSSMRLLAVDAEFTGVEGPALVGGAGGGGHQHRGGSVGNWGSNAVGRGGSSLLFLDFVFDANTPCAVTVYFLAVEREVPKGERGGGAASRGCGCIVRTIGRTVARPQPRCVGLGLTIAASTFFCVC